MNINNFKVLAKFAHGGVPREYQPEVLIQTYEQAKALSATALARHAINKGLKSSIDEPSRPPKTRN